MIESTKDSTEDSTKDSTKDSLVSCLCHEPLRTEANFCARCGREVRQLCPVCFQERRLLANRSGLASPWCGSRGELLCACVRCGRWLAADTRQCPDPACHGLVFPTWPASTGRSADGAGRTSEWVWPAAWDRDNPDRTSPVLNSWITDSPVRAAIAAHGRLNLWVESSLIAPQGPAAGPLACTNEADAPDPVLTAKGDVGWRCWLGHDGVPSTSVHGSGQLSIVGGAAILAANSGYILTGLDPNRSDDVVQLEIGTPIAQVSGAGWWAAWSLFRGAPALWTAPTPASWRNLAYQQIVDTPVEAAPRASAPLVIHGGLTYWIDAEGAIWRLDCRCRELQKMSEPIPGIQRIWCDAAGPHTIRSADNGLRVALGHGLDTGSSREVAGGTAPLRDVFTLSELVMVVGRQVTAIDAKTGDIIGEGKYTGRWIAGALAPAAPTAPDKEPRLLMLTEESGIGSLVALRPSSGVGDELWSAPNVQPLGLIACGESLYIVHDHGVTRLQESKQ